MATMDVDPPDRQNPCSRRQDLLTNVEAEDILISNFNEIIDIPDTDQNIHMKELESTKDSGWRGLCVCVQPNLTGRTIIRKA
ncbi:hypothetical protein TNCT_460871 [Trichonephila clavata]|uniref:Uncharacterized protein n=1 Tax=Trichonephila clavata TaxID=2740835 RepID=A0A8X6GB63_TRICU|nr:hypothetical protein TNCT_460871 [Trichonephila clavata]